MSDAAEPAARPGQASPTRSVRLEPPAPGTLRASAILIAVVLVPGFIASAIGGITASVTVGLCSGAAMSFGTLVRPRVAVWGAVALGAAAALGAAVAGSPLLAGLAVALVILATAPANMHSAGMLTLAPILTMVFAVTDRGWPWWKAGAWGVVGGLVGLGIATIMRFGRRPTQPMDRALAWRHALVLSVAAGLSIVVAELLDVDHGYWVAVTLMVVLRPVAGERREYVEQRMAGTVAGALLALAVVWLLPPGWLLAAAFMFLVALAAYAMTGNYFMQTLFLTPMLLIFLSVGDGPEVTIELTAGRVALTFIGVVLASALAWGMARWDESSGLLQDGEPGPGGHPPADR